MENLAYNKFMENRFNFSFESFIKDAPPTVKDYATRLKYIPQSYTWHAEGNVEIHTRIVLNRAYKTLDEDICFAAFYHDLGKVDTTEPKGNGLYSAHEHEEVSASLVLYSRGWIKEYANPDCVEWIVKNHMRAKYLDSMKESKRNELINHEWFPKLKAFMACDSMDNLVLDEIILGGGNPFSYWWNKFRILWFKMH